MAEQWVTIFTGAFHEVLATQAVLESNGIPTIMPGALMKSVDPFVTGANPLDAFLQVPISAQPLAAEILGLRAEGSGSPDSRALREQSSLSPEQQVASKLARLARNIRWCCTIPLFGWLLGALMGVQYFRTTRGETNRPEGHRITLIIWISEILGTILIYLYLSQ
jgi:hypothetical protein